MSHLGHLRLLEAESIHIMREVASEFQRPVMLYSIGKTPRSCCVWRRKHNVGRKYSRTRRGLQSL
jgi:3'-phosphoadenosine 5'-phosphosulfate sulfotransferase (PAPS reductase)/FAD synthetase